MLIDSRRAPCWARDTYRSRLGLIAALSIALGTFGCGGDAASGPQLVLQVQAPVSESGTTLASLDYEIACDGDWITLDGDGTFVPALRRDGTLELTGPAASPGAGQGELNLWRAVEEPLDGLCLVNLIGRDEQEQTVCNGTETFEAVDGEATFVDTVIACRPLAGFAGAASLAVNIPGFVPGLDVQSVEYTINCDGRGTAFFEGTDASVVINGALEVVEIPMTVGSSVSDSFRDLPAGPCSIQLRVRDQDSEVICVATEGFVIGPSQTTTIQLVLLCEV